MYNCLLDKIIYDDKMWALSEIKDTINNPHSLKNNPLLTKGIKFLEIRLKNVKIQAKMLRHYKNRKKFVKNTLTADKGPKTVT